MNPNDYEAALRWRGVRTPCAACSGSGVIMYASTATWMGGIGGCAMTRGVCDACWGSGDANRPWVNLRKQRDEFQEAVRREAATLLARTVGGSLSITQAAIQEIANELFKLSRGRKPRPHLFYDLCASLAGQLRAMVTSNAPSTPTD
jgi:hypothetical protein